MILDPECKEALSNWLEENKLLTVKIHPKTPESMACICFTPVIKGDPMWEESFLIPFSDPI